MNEMLETQLRETLAARADEIPAGAVRRVRDRDYRPRTRDLRPPIAGGAVACAAVAGGTVLALSLGHPQSAFAGWTAHPTRAAHSQVIDATSGCVAKLEAIPGSAADQAAAAQSGKPTLPSIDSMTQVVSDTRGPYTFVVYATGDAGASCFGGPGFTQASEYRAAQDLAAPGADAVIPMQQASSAQDGNGYSFIDGQAGSDVSAVSLDLADGSTVQATVQGGWFAAWWPGTSQATSATLTTSSGTSTVDLPAPKGPACPQPPSGGSTEDCSISSIPGAGGGISVSGTQQTESRGAQAGARRASGH